MPTTFHTAVVHFGPNDYELTLTAELVERLAMNALRNGSARAMVGSGGLRVRMLRPLSRTARRALAAHIRAANLILEGATSGPNTRLYFHNDGRIYTNHRRGVPLHPTPEATAAAALESNDQPAVAS